MPSAGRIVKHLIAKHGPMTTTSLSTHIPTFEQELVSKSHLKTRILSSLQGDGVLYKKVHRESDSSKPIWRWHFTHESDADLYKNL